jgi:DNA-binding YbaB/EbfC family protein
MSKGFKGMPGNLQGLMQQAQKLQAELAKAQESAQLLTAEGSAGGRMVTVVASGKNVIQSVTIDKQVVNPDDVEMLQDLVMAACNDALNKVQEKMKEELSKITGGMSIPGLM